MTGDILGDENFTFTDRRHTITITKIINQNDINGNLTFDIFVSNSSGYASTYDDPTYETVLFTPYKYSKGGTVSMMIMSELVRSSCVILAAYPLEFDTKMSNVRLPFISF